MARLKNVVTGAIVNVRDEKVELLGSGWTSAESDAPNKAPAKKAASSKTSAQADE